MTIPSAGAGNSAFTIGIASVPDSCGYHRDTRLGPRLERGSYHTAPREKRPAGVCVPRPILQYSLLNPDDPPSAHPGHTDLGDLLIDVPAVDGGHEVGYALDPLMVGDHAALGERRIAHALAGFAS